MSLDDFDRACMERAYALALATESAGNLPIAAVIALDGQVISEGGSEVVRPVYHPGRHAEMGALARVPADLWPRAHAMTCYTTLEPCCMCFGALLLHGVGRVVFGAVDARGGSSCVIPHLPDYYRGGRGVPAWIGPTDPARFDPLYARADAVFSGLPVGWAG